MTRPPAHEWEVVGESGDPTPGNPDIIAFLGQDLRDTANAINRRAIDIQSLASVESWQSKAADAFRNAADDAIAMLRKAFHRYDVASRALGTQPDGGDAYAAAVSRAQAAADKALRDAQNADAESRALQRQIDQLPHGTPDTDPTRISLTRRRQAAQDDLARARAAVQRAKEDHQSAGRAAAAAVRRAITHDGLHDSLIDTVESDVGDALDATGNFLENAGYQVVSDLASVGNAMINDPKATGELLGGAILAGAGGAAEAFGVGVSATGVGAIGGIPIAALAAGAVAVGAGAMADATISLAEDAAGPDRYTMERSGRGGNSSEPQKTKQEYAEQAKALGYSTRKSPRQLPFDSHGQPGYFNGKEWITPDVDGHNVQNGWKMFALKRGKVRFSQRNSLPDSVEDEGGAGDVADAAGTERDPLERAPAFLELGGGALAEGADTAEQGVVGLRVDVKVQVGAACRLLERVVDADPGSLVAGVCEGGQSAGGGLVQHGQAVLTRGTDVVRGAWLGVAHP